MQPIDSISGILPAATPRLSETAKAENTFADMMTELVSDVSKQQQSADRAIEQVHTGKAKHLHEAMIAMEQADISIKYMVQVRNKALEAYQEIMRMQV